MHSPQYRFGPFVLQPGQRLLMRDGEAVPLGGRAFDLLVALASQGEQVSLAQDLIDTVWGHAAVEPANLQVQVHALRKVLGPRAIATVPRKGYRLTVPVTMRSLADPGAARAGLRPMSSRHALGRPGIVNVVAATPEAQRALAHRLCREFAAACRASALWLTLPAASGLQPVMQMLQGLAHVDAAVVLEDCDRSLHQAHGVVVALRAAFPHLRILALVKAPLPLAGARVATGAPPRPHAAETPATGQPLRGVRSMRGGPAAD